MLGIFASLVIAIPLYAQAPQEISNVSENFIQAEKTQYSSKADIEKYIRQVARDNGINEEKFIAVSKCESGLNPLAHGDKNLGGSYGLWQIHKPSHPDVSYEQATDIIWSTEWAAEKWKANPMIWTCYRNLGKIK